MAALRTDIRLTDGGQLNRWESRIVGAVVVEGLPLLYPICW
jgi:hypothetical protein